ncbi:MAG: HipA domain-containing protein [Gallionella sp.]
MYRHARNHAAFWNGTHLTLTPAYDICPQSRAGNEAPQTMKIHRDNNLSQLKVCISIVVCCAFVTDCCT